MLESFLRHTQSGVVGGAQSGEAHVESRVLEGTIFGPILCLLHINNHPSNVTSTVQLSPDVCLLYTAAYLTHLIKQHCKMT